MSQGRGRKSRLLLSVIGGILGIFLVVVPAELALRLIAVFSPETRYLATRRGGELRRRFTSLQEYLATQPAHVVPHRRWFNHWTNALGFNDEEFTVPKPAGRFRIMAVGDSFTYGLVPYPQNVMTLLEASLRAACPDRDLDLLNFGIGGTNVADYRTIIELGYATYEPDLVLVNVYAGNDGPDLYYRTSEGLSLQWLLRRSYLWNYIRRLLVVRRSVPDAGALAAAVQGPTPAGARRAEQPRGGQVVDPGHRLRDDEPALVGPIFDEKVFRRLLAGELGRFYVPRDARAIDRAWHPTLEQLEVARTHVTGHGGRLAITLYPSVLQVDKRLRSEVIDQLRGQPRGAKMTPEAIDPDLPNRILLAYCREHGVPCFDLTPASIAPARIGRAALQGAGTPLDPAREPRGGRSPGSPPGTAGVRRDRSRSEAGDRMTARQEPIRSTTRAVGEPSSPNQCSPSRTRSSSRRNTPASEGARNVSVTTVSCPGLTAYGRALAPCRDRGRGRPDRPGEPRPGPPPAPTPGSTSRCRCSSGEPSARGSIPAPPPGSGTPGTMRARSVSLAATAGRVAAAKMVPPRPGSRFTSGPSHPPAPRPPPPATASRYAVR